MANIGLELHRTIESQGYAQKPETDPITWMLHLLRTFLCYTEVRIGSSDRSWFPRRKKSTRLEWSDKALLRLHGQQEPGNPLPRFGGQ